MTVHSRRAEETPSARARALHAAEPSLTPTEIARRLTTRYVKVSRQTVEAALKVTGARKTGRPRTGAAVLLRERDLGTYALELARADAHRLGLTLAQVVADAARRGLALTDPSVRR